MECRKLSKVDVLLVYPIWVKKAGRGTLQRMLPPLGILSLASYLEQHNFKVAVIDLHAEEMDPEEFKCRLKQLSPKYVGISVLSAHVTPAHYIAKICKDLIPEVQVIVGGVHAEANPEEMLRNRCIDAVCRGDGEEVLLEFVSGKELSQIKGLSFKRNLEVIHNPPQKTELNLDKYPFPAYHLVDFTKYFPPAGSYRDLPAMNVLLTRGCPGNCTFCNSAKTTLRSRSAEKSVELIKLLRNKYGIRQIYFYDDTFTANPQFVRDFCNIMIEQNVDVKWICYVRGDMFNEKTADLLAKAGCHQVLIGIESGSQKLMQQIGKPIQKEKYHKMVKIAHRHGIEVRGSFIIGHLEESKETLEETLQFAIDLNLDFFQLNIMTPYPGTALYKQAKLEGLLIHEDFSRYGQNEVVLKLSNLTAEQLLEFEKKAFIRFYLRPKVIWQQLKRLRKWRQISDLLKGFYILLIEGLSKVNNNGPRLNKWLEYDVQSLFDQDITMPTEIHLTYQVRQEVLSIGK